MPTDERDPPADGESNELTDVHDLAELDASTRFEPCLARLEALTLDGRITVKLPNGNKPVAALIGLPDSPSSIVRAVHRREQVLIQFVDGKPIIVARVRERLRPDTGALEPGSFDP
jgi:hypothetical protein